MLKNLSFKAKLLALCTFLCSVSAILAIVSYVGLNRVEKPYEEISEIYLPNIENLGSLDVSYQKTRIALRTLGLPGITPAQGEKAAADALKYIGEYEETEKKYLLLPFGPGEEMAYKKVSDEWKQFKSVGERVLAYRKAGSGDKILEIFFKDCPEAAEKFDVAMESLTQLTIKNADDKQELAVSTSKATSKLMFVVSIVGIIAGMVTGFMFSSSIVKTITSIVNNLRDNASQVSSASQQIASASQELSSANTEQAASLEETAASIEEMSSMVAKNAENAKSTAGNSSSRVAKLRQMKEKK